MSLDFEFKILGFFLGKSRVFWFKNKMSRIYFYLDVSFVDMAQVEGL